MWDHIVFVATMALAGIVGGAASYLLSSSQNDHTPVFRDRVFYRTVFIGLVASFLVPLFLQLISSNLIDNTLADDKLDFNNLLILGSYCLIVAISSRKFIEMITNSTLDKLNTKVDALSGDVATIKDAHTEEDSVEPDDSTDETLKASASESDAGETNRANGTNGSDSATTDSLQAMSTGTPTIIGSPQASTTKGPQLSPADHARYRVLKALTKSAYMFRSMDGIRTDAGLPESTVNETLRQLLDEKLASQSFSTQGIRFNITPSGRERLAQYTG
ncbi:hypothetical protein DFQ01_12462 [Paenibacillus cellulosilyticus]|uniref:YEATS-Like-Associating Three TM domain-containing protein n=1 Tax=Paenibacillus cellulosilyticus TaxID=375489 RepID=A0A2V2YMT6_9BACL|nr:YEATS-associated helix-containing protein [Paenibacillus cellulosilyticus]PWV95887.1 hypothetical protein DFQ01_12462 [Paenibacillus cellulosilyticus]QKS47756.1 hypothetical protein HUB94_25725 [Paenibacillus cellulosilyticus]